MEFTTPTTTRHLGLLNATHTACGRSLEGMDMVGRVSLPWNVTKRCNTCRRVLASGGLGFYVTPGGGMLTHEDIQALSAEAEQGYDISQLRNHLRDPTMGPGREPGPDAMRWYPNPRR
jgi:hypothetical protein